MAVFKYPLHFDLYYKVMINLSDCQQAGNFLVIPDTASDRIIISGSECEHCNLSDGEWITSLYDGQSNNSKSCPLIHQKSRGRHLKDDGKVEKYSYMGGQHDTIAIHWVILNGHWLVDIGVVMYVFNHKLNEPPQNIMGLTRLSSCGICQIYFDFQHSEFCLISRPLNPPLHLNTKYRYLYGPSPQDPQADRRVDTFLVSIDLVELVNQKHQRITMPSIQYVLFDTGTNYTFINNEYCQEVPEVLIINGQQQRLVLENSPSHRFITPAHQIPVPADILVLGVKSFDHYNLLIDFDHHTLELI